MKNIKILPMILLLFLLGSCKKSDNLKSEHQHEPTKVNGEYYAADVNNGIIKEDTLKDSPRRMSMNLIDGCHVHIEYSSPGVKGRTIWGGLVPFSKVWVTGAHQATTINFNQNVKINGRELKAGEYAFFTIPGKNKWTIIFNKRAKQHLTDQYKVSEDALRLEVVPEVLHYAVPRLTYQVEASHDKGGMVIMSWEKIKISFEVTVLKP